MTRVVSGAVLIAIAVAVVWFAPPLLFFAVAIAVAVIAVHELIVLARAAHLQVSMTAAAFSTSMVVGSSRLPDALDLFLVTALIGAAAVTLGGWQGGGDALATVSASLFPALYIGLPVAAMVGVRALGGPPALFLLMLTIIVSDSMQYYTGRLFGRRPLAPLVSPKKTVEGALGGVVFGTALFTIVGAWWLPAVPAAFRALVGVTIVALGIAGDLFESMLKRSANVKDSSSLIPGHGGILDRIDALLFAAPVYYIVLRYV